MRDFRDAKAMAQTLRETLKAKSIAITHGESLELVAKILGFHDWNELSARIKSEHQPTVIEPAALPPIMAGARLPILPLRDIVLFPKMTVPLSVSREVSRRAVERAMASDRRVLAVKQRRATDDNPSLQDLYRVGVAASIIEQTTFDDDITRLLVKGLERAAIVQLAEGQFLTAEVAPVEESRGQEADAFDLARTVLEAFQAHWNVEISRVPQRFRRLSQLQPAELAAGLSQRFRRLLQLQPGELADAITRHLAVGIDEQQDLLETSDVISRLEKIRALIKAGRQAA
ncbi:MAG TPA: LON peptidase substrate-binding domain-containing protein [Xanthobacteraceae bacterium]